MEDEPQVEAAWVGRGGEEERKMNKKTRGFTTTKELDRHNLPLILVKIKNNPLFRCTLAKNPFPNRKTSSNDQSELKCT